MYVFLKARGPRSTFQFDATPEERAIMGRHVAYWAELGSRGISIVFGPVLDPAWAYGVGIYRVEDQAHMERLVAADPARALLSYEIFEFPHPVFAPALAERLESTVP